jgi:hypothetical protein
VALVFSTNNNPVTGAAAMFLVKQQLKAAGWTVPRSSDGSTFNASGDQISASGSGAGGMDNSRAWFVIQMPGASGRQFCIQRNSSTGTNTSQQWRIKYSAGAGFTSGGSNIQVPSATDEGVVLGGGSDGSPTFANLFGGTDGSYRYQIGTDNASPYAFFAIAYPPGIAAANCTSSFFLDPVVNGPSGDADPYVIGVDASTGLDTNLAGGNLITETTCPFAWLKKGLSGQGFVRVPAVGGETFVSSAFQNSIPTNRSQSAPDPQNGFDNLIAFEYNRRGGMGAPVGYKGVSTLLLWQMSAIRNSGDTYTVSSVAKARMSIGWVSVPWDASTSPQQ